MHILRLLFIGTSLVRERAGRVWQLWKENEVQARAPALPWMLKSYHSIAVPRTVARSKFFFFDEEGAVFPCNGVLSRLATFRRKIEVFGVLVNSAGQSKARRG
jgi:hypothetical protein